MPRNPRRVFAVLKSWGVSVVHGRTQPTWRGNGDQLEGLLFDAHQAWRRLSKRANGNHEEHVRLNQDWELVRRRFAKHGIVLE